MALALTPRTKDFKEFYGRPVDTMQELLAEGRTPLSVSGLMEARLNYGEKLTGWVKNYFQTGDALVRHPAGNVKLILDSEDLRGINRQSRIGNGFLVLSTGAFKSLEGIDFTKEELEKYANGQLLTREEAKENPLWRYLARDQNLLNEYVDSTFDYLKAAPSDEEKGMQIDIKSISIDSSVLKPCFINDLFMHSLLSGGYGINWYAGRLVGEKLSSSG